MAETAASCKQTANSTDVMAGTLNEDENVSTQGATKAAEENKQSPGKTTKKKNTKVLDMEPDLKKLKQRRINVAGAPKMPLNGYVRFMNDRREQLRREHPNRSALEHTKMIGEEWQQLPDKRKAPYLEAASKDKAKYQEALQKFLTENPDILANELNKAKKASNNSSNVENKNSSTPKDKQLSNNSAANNSATKKPNAKAAEPKEKRPRTVSPDPDDIPLAQVKRTPTPPTAPPVANPLTAGKIPIYTKEFMDHNRNLDIELRTLRKTKSEYEHQNSVLEQHIENTKAGRTKVLNDVQELWDETKRLTQYNNKLRQKIVAALGDLPLPDLQLSAPNEQNVDTYLKHLASLTSTPGSRNNVALITAAKRLHNVDCSDLNCP